MKLIWSPETASKAYIDTVKACRSLKESSVAEMVSAMAAGWDAQLIVETWSKDGAVETGIGLAIACQYTGGRHVCIVSDEESKAEYIVAMGKAGKWLPEVIVGEAEEVMEELPGIDFMVVDSKGSDFKRVFKGAKLGDKGAVLILKSASLRAASEFRWPGVLDEKSRIVRSVILPLGKGLDIVHVGADIDNSSFKEKIKRGVGNSDLNENIKRDVGNSSLSQKITRDVSNSDLNSKIKKSVDNSSLSKKIKSRWIKRIDPISGEEYVIRK